MSTSRFHAFNRQKLALKESHGDLQDFKRFYQWLFYVVFGSRKRWSVAYNPPIGSIYTYILPSGGLYASTF